MVDSAIPVARATCAMPPYPIACASVAAHTRRDRSVRTGDSAACFARRVARSTSARYYSLIRSTRSYFLTGPNGRLGLLVGIQPRRSFLAEALPMNAPMRTPVVKSPEIFVLVKHTFIDAAGAGPPPRAGPA